MARACAGAGREGCNDCNSLAEAVASFIVVKWFGNLAGGLVGLNSIIHAPRCWIVAAAMLLPLSGCGTVIVEFDLDARVTEATTGNNVPGTKRPDGAVRSLPAVPGALPSFTPVQYVTPLFDWTIAAGTLGLGGNLSSRTQERLCLRFDQAAVESNFQREERPLLIYHSAVFRNGKWSQNGSTKKEKMHNVFTAPPLCVTSGDPVEFGFAIDVSQLFPSKKMFNVSWSDNEPILQDKGIGNWLKLVVPIESPTDRRVLQVLLTVKDSKARIANY